MNGAEPLSRPWIVGPGRLGLALASALSKRPEVGRVRVAGRRSEPPPDPLFASGIVGYFGLDGPVEELAPSLILIAVPDAAIPEVAHRLAGLRHPPVVALHTSGARGQDVLTPLADLGYPTGSLHPLAAVPHGEQGRKGISGAWFGLDGDEVAVHVAQQVVETIGGRVFRIAEGAKPTYHAASVIASNYVVSVLAFAERLMARSGLPETTARAALAALAAGAVRNVSRSGPGAALTGPISRGDVETVELHLAQLSGRDRELYSLLAAEALELARAHGLNSEIADELAKMIGSP